VIWKVVLPSGSDVKGTAVGETSPTVWGGQLHVHTVCSVLGELTRNGANILDWRTTGAELSAASSCTFWRFESGPAAAGFCLEPAMVSYCEGCCACCCEALQKSSAEMQGPT
jgi:hypothetical protein